MEMQLISLSPHLIWKSRLFKIENEYQEIQKLIAELISVLKGPEKVLQIITKELKELKEKYADKRRYAKCCNNG